MEGLEVRKALRPGDEEQQQAHPSLHLLSVCLSDPVRLLLLLLLPFLSTIVRSCGCEHCARALFQQGGPWGSEKISPVCVCGSLRMDGWIHSFIHDEDGGRHTDR